MMRSLRLGVFGLCAVTFSFAASCDSGSGGGPEQQPLDPAQATLTVNQRIDELIGGLGDSSAQLDLTDSTTVATGSINQATGTSSPCPVSGSTGGGATDTGGVDAVPQSATQALDDFLHQVAQEAREHVFRDELVELQDGNQVVYKVDPASACGTDATCFEKLSANPVRFVVTANTDDSLNVSLLVGVAQHNPASALLGTKRLSVRVNLAEVMEVLRLYVEPEDQADFPDRLAGVLEGSIEKRAEGDFAITGSIIESFELLVGQAQGKPVAVAVQPSAPTAQLTINSLTNVLGFAANLSAVDVSVAGAAVCDEQCGAQEQTGTFSGHVGGLTGAVAVTQGTQELSLVGLGLGDSTSYVAINDGLLGTLDVNAQNGRKVTVTFKQTPEGTLVTFDPALDLKLAIMLNKLSESLRVDMPAWLNDEIFDVMFGGAAKPSVLLPAATCDASGNVSTKDQIEVVTGELSLRASSLASPVDVAAGMCLVPVQGADSSSHPFSQLAAGVCQ